MGAPGKRVANGVLAALLGLLAALSYATFIWMHLS
jgi:hypothetical protein